MPGPIKPEDVDKLKQETIPEAVFEAFNLLIAVNINGGRATVLQGEVIARIMELMPEGTKKGDIYAKGWLNVEPIYRKAGWIVRYDKPSYNETYEASFEFVKPKA
jgi:hypothetical protein